MQILLVGQLYLKCNGKGIRTSRKKNLLHWLNANDCQSEQIYVLHLNVYCTIIIFLTEYLSLCELMSFNYSLFDVYQIVLIFRIQEVLTLLRNLLSPAPSLPPLLKASVQALITLSLSTLWPAEGTVLRPAPPSMLYTEQVNWCIWECLRLFKDLGRQEGVKLQYDTQLSAKSYK